MRSNFLLGEIIITVAVRKLLGREPMDLIARHAIGETGNITLAEAEANLKGYKEADVIMSRYAADPTDPDKGNVLVITEPSWGKTTVKLETEK